MRPKVSDESLDSAIEHCREVITKQCGACKKDHEELLSMLEELREYRNETNNDRTNDN